MAEVHSYITRLVADLVLYKLTLPFNRCTTYLVKAFNEKGVEIVSAYMNTTRKMLDTLPLDGHTPPERPCIRGARDAARSRKISRPPIPITYPPGGGGGKGI
jgi:hypothetical protein